MSDGNLVGDAVYEAATLARYDRLPPVVRRVFQRAPYPFVVGAAEKLLRDGVAPEDVARALGQEMLRRRDEEIEKAWGGDHPMIGRRDKSRV